MRLKQILTILISLILISPVFALRIVNIETSANEFQVYGDFIAYEADEEIFVYNIKTKEKEFIAKGKSPSVYGFIVTFHSSEEDVNKDVNSDGDFNEPVIRYFNLKKKEIFNTDLIGSRPSVHGNKILFDVFEKDVDFDLNEDDDKEDHIIHIYDIETKETKNTKIVGENVFAGLNVAAFETDEKEYGSDLSRDTHLSDKVIRVIFFDEKSDNSVVNTAIPGTAPFIYKDEVLTFTANEALTRLDVNEDNDYNDDYPVVFLLPDVNKIDIKLTGASPSAFKDIVVFAEENKLIGYSLLTKSWVMNDIYCSAPVIFEDFAVVLTHEKLVEDLNNDGDTKDSVLRILYFEDIDKDDFLDIVDNCPAIDNDQKDSDFDGEGNDCDADYEAEIEELDEVNSSEQANQNNLTDLMNISETKEETVEDIEISLPQEEDKKQGSSFLKVLFFIILLLVFVIFMIKWVPAYLEKKRKGFGF